MSSPAFLEWANRSDLPRALAVTVTITRRGDGQPLTLYLTDSAAPKGTWDNQHNWVRCIHRPPFISHQMQQAFNGRSLASFGDLELALDDRAKLGPDGGLSWDEALNDYRWAGGAILSQVGGPDLAWPDWEPAQRGILGRLTQERGLAKVPVYGKAAGLQTIKIPPDTYSEAEGVPSATVGKVKPCCIGPCNNITPVLISEAGPWVYQVHAHGPIQTITEVRVADVATASATINLANGTISFAAKPSGQVTCDVRGWARGGVYLQSAAQIMEAILRQWGGATDADIDAAAFAAMHAAVPAPLALYLTSASDIRTVLDNCCLGLPLVWLDDALGRYTLRQFAAPSGQPVLELYDRTVGDPTWGAAICWNARSQPAPRWWSKCTVHGDRNWTVNNNPAASLGADRQAWLKEDYRSREALGTAPTLNGQVTEGEYKTFMAYLADCQAQALREIGLHGVERNLVTLDCLYAALTLGLGDVVRVWSKVGGMSGGWSGMVVERKATLPGQASVKLWG
ncbi:MAG: hypothetical protein HY910_12140 [Desulfarculus sp.]|nr:hypothetical protein [Desulfarculus sp.]